MIRILLILGVSGFLCNTVAAVELPAEVSGVTIGMTKDSLLKARPAIKRVGAMGGPIDLSLPKLILYEDFRSSSSVFTTITYILEDSRIVALALTGYPLHGQESAVRKKILKDARGKWGKGHRHKVFRDPIRKGKGAASVSWENEGIEIILMLPVEREAKDTKVTPVSLQIRTARATNKPLAELPMTQEEKKNALKQNDIDELDAQ